MPVPDLFTEWRSGGRKWSVTTACDCEPGDQPCIDECGGVHAQAVAVLQALHPVDP